MGGLGSGNHWPRNGRRSTSAMWQLDVRYLHRKGLLKTGSSFNLHWSQDGKPLANIDISVHEHHVTLKYRARPSGREEWDQMEYPVGLEWTACHYGGERPWFLCPSCGRRVAVLFGGMYYACRRCHNLAYTSQREDRHGRLLNRARKLRAKLGGDYWWRKPKGMHQKTFDRLVVKYCSYEKAADAAFYERAKKILGW